MPKIVVPKVRVELTRGCPHRFLSLMPRVSIGFSGAAVFQIRDYNTPMRSSGHGQLSEVRAHLVHNLGRGRQQYCLSREHALALSASAFACWPKCPRIVHELFLKAYFCAPNYAHIR